MSFKKLTPDHRDDFPVVWRGKTYFVSTPTVGIKKALCRQLTVSMLAVAAETFGRDTKEFKDYQTSLFAAPPSWTTMASEAVIAYIASLDGITYFARLLLGLTVEEMSDETLNEFLIEDVNSPTGGLIAAINLAKETSDPKA